MEASIVRVQFPIPIGLRRIFTETMLLLGLHWPVEAFGTAQKARDFAGLGPFRLQLSVRRRGQI